MKNLKKLTIIIGVALLLLAPVAYADPIGDPLDPAVLHIGSPPNTGTYLFGSEVRPISDTSLGILENGNGQPTLIDPALLLILGVPNKTDATFTAPGITVTSGGSGVLGGTNIFSGTWNVSTGYAGNFTGGDDVYQFMGLVPSGNASNNWTNWHGAELAVNGIDATGFGIFVYQLTGTGITGGSTVNVTFDDALADGIFVIAYGQAEQGNQIHSFTTPFTEAGMTKVPEPEMLLLLGLGLLGLGVARRKKG